MNITKSGGLFYAVRAITIENSAIGKFSRTFVSQVFYVVHTKHEYSAIGKKARRSVRTFGVPQENIKGFWVF